MSQFWHKYSQIVSYTQDWRVRLIVANFINKEWTERSYLPRDTDWSIKEKSLFIESLILEFPVPPITIVTSRKESDYILDGVQRVRALCDFMEEGMPLNSVLHLSDLRGKTWSDLDMNDQCKFRNLVIRTVFISRRYKEDVLADIFTRLNPHYYQGQRSL